MHITETCEDGLLNIIADVQIAPAPVADGDDTPIIHEALKEKGLLPETQFVHTGYLDAELLAESKKNYGVDLFGPTRPDYRWQARAKQGFGMQDFKIDWERKKAICPEGRESVEWTPFVDNRGNDVIRLKFSTAHLGPVRAASCARSRAPGTRAGASPYARKSNTRHCKQRGSEKRPP